MYEEMFKELGLLGQCEYVDNMIRDIDHSIDNISNIASNIRKKNPERANEILKMLKGE